MSAPQHSAFCPIRITVPPDVSVEAAATPAAPRVAAFDAPLLRPADLAAVSPEKPWLWHGYLAPGNITLLSSQWKADKTTLASVLLARLKTGGQLAGLTVAAGRAIVVSEESREDWRRRSAYLDWQPTFRAGAFVAESKGFRGALIARLVPAQDHRSCSFACWLPLPASSSVARDPAS